MNIIKLGFLILSYVIRLCHSVDRKTCYVRIFNLNVLSPWSTDVATIWL